jgi:hypothetical protein
MGKSAAADAVGKSERRKRTRFFEETDGFINDGRAFDAVVSHHAGGDDLGVLLRGGACEIEFVSNLSSQVGSAGENGEKYRDGGEGYKFHKYCQSKGSAKAGMMFQEIAGAIKK